MEKETPTQYDQRDVENIVAVNIGIAFAEYSGHLYLNYPNFKDSVYFYSEGILTKYKIWLSVAKRFPDFFEKSDVKSLEMSIESLELEFGNRPEVVYDSNIKIERIKDLFGRY